MKAPARPDKRYRIMWCDDSGASTGYHHPPVSPEKLLQITFGGLEGTPVDALVATVGPCAGYTESDPGVPYYQLPDSVMRPLTRPMIYAIAARHWARGADGLYLFNWTGTPVSYHRDHRPTLDDIADPRRLKYKDKTYVLMRESGSFPNCLPTGRPLPARLGPAPLQLDIVVEDDLPQYGARVERVSLRLLFKELTVADRLEVRLNGHPLSCSNPLRAEAIAPGVPTAWQVYDVQDHKPRQGANELLLRLLEGPAAFRREVPLEITDAELDIVYGHTPRF